MLRSVRERRAVDVSLLEGELYQAWHEFLIGKGCTKAELLAMGVSEIDYQMAVQGVRHDQYHDEHGDLEPPF